MKLSRQINECTIVINSAVYKLQDKYVYSLFSHYLNLYKHLIDIIQHMH